ncbi:DUF2993 domain-containing protein [Microcoleus sp. FACHB-831]|uniref:LmeA family phospholipid-binding protein n=1 Tax=Microcoleus sp. FACHB-831 TaxID=2692827 RepID=UPI0016824876|nr:DUF2993 domain-containing protein [Microcoleus sp. FACHB-831]MBD1923289.1 DUF2993 domain-containing protein [Microcoleus sp. FACHB-831]
MTQEQAGLAQQALNKVAEMGLASQVDAVDKVDIDVRTDPLKLAQGEVDSVAIAGDGLTILQDLRLEQLDLETGNVSIDLLSAVFGKVELTQPTDAKVRVVLIQADLNHALNSKLARNWVRNQNFQVLGKTYSIELKQVECDLPGDGEILFTAGLLLRAEDKSYPIVASVVLWMGDNGDTVCLRQSKFAEGEDLPIEITAALLMRVSTLLKQRYIKQKDFSLNIEQIAVEAGRIVVQVKARVERVPVE